MRTSSQLQPSPSDSLRTCLPAIVLLDCGAILGTVVRQDLGVVINGDRTQHASALLYYARSIRQQKNHQKHLRSSSSCGEWQPVQLPFSRPHIQTPTFESPLSIPQFQTSTSNPPLFKPPLSNSPLSNPHPLSAEHICLRGHPFGSRRSPGKLSDPRARLHLARSHSEQRERSCGVGRRPGGDPCG
jgi:hypothetical protein